VQSVPEQVASNLAELGLPEPGHFFKTMLMHDGFFVGWKCHYDGGHAILHANDNTMGFYDEQGRLLKTVALQAERHAA